MNVNYDAISAWAAVFVAAVAVISIAVEARRAAFSCGVDVLLRYSAEFAGPEFVHRRRELARMLKRRLERGLTQKEQDDLLATATYFLDHYETIGYLLRRRILDRQLTFVYYAYTFHKYWPFLKELIDACQKEIPTLWEDVVWLDRAFMRISRRPVRNRITELTEEERREMESFLNQELAPAS